MSPQRKLNTYGVESPCECLPGVGSFLANPGLSKEQLVPSCMVKQLWVVILLIIKGKMVCGISSCKIRQNMQPFDAD